MKGLKTVAFLADLDSLSSFAPGAASTVKITFQEEGKEEPRTIMIFGEDTLVAFGKKFSVFTIESPAERPLFFHLLHVFKIRDGEKSTLDAPKDDNDPFAKP